MHRRRGRMRDGRAENGAIPRRGIDEHAQGYKGRRAKFKEQRQPKRDKTEGDFSLSSTKWRRGLGRGGTFNGLRKGLVTRKIGDPSPLSPCIPTKFPTKKRSSIPSPNLTM